MNHCQRSTPIPINIWLSVFFLTAVVTSYLYIDKPVAWFFHAQNLNAYNSILKNITNLALSGFYLISFLILALTFKFIYRDKVWEARAWFLWLCVAIPSTVTLVLKMLFGRARPELLIHNNVYGFLGFQNHAQFWSFPSGHTTTIMGLTIGLAFLFPRYKFSFIILGFSIALTRVILLRHYFSDILIATYLALLQVGLLYCILNSKNWLSAAFNKTKMEK